MIVFKIVGALVLGVLAVWFAINVGFAVLCWMGGASTDDV